MKIKSLYIEKWRNLEDFKIDFSPDQITTVLIGANGSGKSNLLEAIVRIFRFLDLWKEQPPFNYTIKYICYGHNIEVASDFYDVDKEGKTQRKRLTGLSVDGKTISRRKFREKSSEFLPKHIFGYYSGKDMRFEELFDAHAKEFYELSLGTKKTSKKKEKQAQELRKGSFIVNQVIASLFYWPTTLKRVKIRNYF